MKKNHKITNNNKRRLSLQIVAGTLLLEVCGNGIAPTLAFSLASTESITLGNDCTKTLPPSRRESFIKPASPPVAGNLLLEVCSNGIAPTLAADLANDCTETLAPSRAGSFVKAVSPVPKSQRLNGLKASNPTSSPLAQNAQVANNAIQSIDQVAIVDANLVKLDQPLNSQLPNAISQRTQQDLCEVGSGTPICDTGAGAPLCDVGGTVPANIPVVPPTVGGRGLNPLYFLPLALLPFLFGSDSSPDTPRETPPETPPPETPPPVTPPPETPPPVTPPPVTPPPEAIPEPSTALGGLVAIGLGILMKRKYAKISSRKAAKTIRDITQD